MSLPCSSVAFLGEMCRIRCPWSASNWEYGIVKLSSFALVNQFSITLSCKPFLPLLVDYRVQLSDELFIFVYTRDSLGGGWIPRYQIRHVDSPVIVEAHLDHPIGIKEHFGV